MEYGEVIFDSLPMAVFKQAIDDYILEAIGFPKIDAYPAIEFIKLHKNWRSYIDGINALLKETEEAINICFLFGESEINIHSVYSYSIIKKAVRKYNNYIKLYVIKGPYKKLEKIILRKKRDHKPISFNTYDV